MKSLTPMWIGLIGFAAGVCVTLDGAWWLSSLVLMFVAGQMASGLRLRVGRLLAEVSALGKCGACERGVPTTGGLEAQHESAYGFCEVPFPCRARFMRLEGRALLDAASDLRGERIPEPSTESLYGTF